MEETIIKYLEEVDKVKRARAKKTTLTSSSFHIEIASIILNDNDDIHYGDIENDGNNRIMIPIECNVMIL